jgi:predicted TPR repeat methyltransferase
MQTKRFLDDVYGKMDGTSVAGFYDEWAGSYDSELAENAYRTPGRLAQALVATGTPLDARILDYGCGTGLSGNAFVSEGYTLIDGTDVSPGMIAEAESKQIYGRLWLADASTPRSIPPGDYDVIAAVGVISPGAAPSGLLQELANLLEPGGRLAFSFNDHALEDQGYLDALRALPDLGLTLLYEQYGDHLPGIGLKSTIYVFEKA